MKQPVIVACLLLMSAFACKNTQSEAEDAKVEAERKAVEAQREADAKVADAKLKAAEAEAKAVKERNEAAAELQKEIGAVDRKVAYVKERAEKTSGATRKNADAAVVEVDRRRQLVNDDMQKLSTAVGEAWITAKAETEKNIAALKQALDNFETTVTGKAAR